MRSRWIAAVLLAAALTVCAGAQAVPHGASAMVSRSALSRSQIAPGVWVHRGQLQAWGPDNGGDVANLAFVVGRRCVAVIDSGGTPALGLAWRAALQRTTALPICYVINTHAHPDHVLGNGAFATTTATTTTQTPQFVASTRFAAALAAREPYFRRTLQQDFGIHLGPAGVVYPDIAVAQRLELDLGGRVLRLQAWPTSHTDNDLTVFDVRTRTLFAGDLLFAQHLPVLDGHLRGWLCTLQGLRPLPVATVVPGHGPPSRAWPTTLDAERAYLLGLLRDTRAALGRGLTLAQAVDHIAPEPGMHWQLVEHFQRRNVTAAYAELEWEAQETQETHADQEDLASTTNPGPPCKP